MAKITYHKLTRDHLPYRMGWLNDPEVSRYLGCQVRKKTNEKYHREWFDKYEKDKTRDIFIIESDGEMIGQVGLLDINLNDKNACLFILIGEKNHWNCGFGSEAMEFILDYGFNKLGLHKIWLGVHARNKNAINLYKKFGFEQEGLFKQHVLYKDGYDDEIQMAKLNLKDSDESKSEISIQKVSVKAILRRNETFLLLKQAKSGFWELPGGKLELGEKIEDCFTREISEELGWTGVKLEKVVHVWTLDWTSNQIQFVLIAVTAEPKDEPINLSDEHTEYCWFTLPEIEKLKVRSPELITAIKKSY